MKTLKTWPKLPMIAFVCAVFAGVAWATLVSYYRSASPVAPNAANVNRVDQAGISKGSTEAANTDRSKATESSQGSATDPLTTKTEQQAGDRSRTQRPPRTQSKGRNANRSRVEFKGPPVRSP